MENKVFIQHKPFNSSQTVDRYFVWYIQTLGSVYLLNVNNRFSIKTGYRYSALVYTIAM